MEDSAKSEIWITPKQVAAKLGGVLTYRTVINMIWRGDFGEVRRLAERKLVVREAAVDAYITSSTVNPADGQVTNNG